MGGRHLDWDRTGQERQKRQKMMEKEWLTVKLVAALAMVMSVLPMLPFHTHLEACYGVNLFL